MICPKCSAENPGHARFCGTCGHAVASGPSHVAPPSVSAVANFFKWVGYILTGLIVLGILTNF